MRRTALLRPKSAICAFIALTATGVSLVACSSDPPEVSVRASAEPLIAYPNRTTIKEGGAEALGILSLVNDANVSESELQRAELTAGESMGILRVRRGPDAVLGTPDDRRFESLRELDQADNVTARTIWKLLAHAKSTNKVNECVDFDRFSLCPTRVQNAGSYVGTFDDTIESTFSLNTTERRPLVATSPALKTGLPIVDAAWRMAIDDVNSLHTTSTLSDGRTVPRYKAGVNWGGAWARDLSYSLDFGLAYLDKDRARGSLDSIVETANGKRRIIQDEAGMLGNVTKWPAMSDSIVWAIGAKTWNDIHGGRLSDDYEIIKNSLARAEAEALDPIDGLFFGDASFLDSGSAYPPGVWERVAQTKALSTNVLYQKAYQIAGAIAPNAEERTSHQRKANSLKDAINSRFAAANGYGYYIKEDGNLDPRWEGLGSALACRFGLTSDFCHGIFTAEASIRSPRLNDSLPWSYGTPCLWPQHPDWIGYEATWGLFTQYYHNGMIWPFVEAYMTLDASRVQRYGRLVKGLANQIYLAGQQLTFHEYHHWETARAGGSRAQLWSASGYLGSILQGVFGIETDSWNLFLRPRVPVHLGGVVHVAGLPYREATLDIQIYGAGADVRSFTVDGVIAPEQNVPATIARGNHRVEIDLGPEVPYTCLANGERYSSSDAECCSLHGANGVCGDTQPRCTSNCNPGQRECYDTGSFVSCSLASDGCYRWSNPLSCGGGTCRNGSCSSACTPRCAGRTCGTSDDCGGVCQPGGGCTSQCTPQCTGKRCGSADGCGRTCQEGSGCTPSCTPQCSGKACGASDGCGGVCQQGGGCCQNECTIGQTRCLGPGHVQTCIQKNGCAIWDASLAACGTGATCVQDRCVTTTPGWWCTSGNLCGPGMTCCGGGRCNTMNDGQCCVVPGQPNRGHPYNCCSGDSTAQGRCL